MTVTFADVQAAAARIAGYAHRTPVITSRTLDAQTGAQAFLKAENLQRIGAFKYRGACNAIRQLSTAQQQRGVITYSSGNHAQAVALVCQQLGIKAVIVMPDNSPAAKVSATQGYGAHVVFYKPSEQDRARVTHEMADEHGYVVVPPYDHPHVIAGQGTAALELLQEVGELDGLLVCCGGGGLLSGCAIAAKALSPSCRVVGVEPELANDATLSFNTKTLHTIHNPPTIADGTRTPSLGELTFPLVLQHVDAMVTVSEEQIKAAVRFAFYRLKLVLEPSGALGLAALLHGAIAHGGHGARVGVILSGGNIDGAMMGTILAEG
jgi:threo-3-hydroxy-L-aspartate ammonia-lyase